MSRREDRPSMASDEHLLVEFLAGDPDAFGTLVERHSEELYRFIGRFIRDGAAAEDIAQETFIQVFHSAAGFDPSRRLRPWLYTIAANKARDYLRSRVRKRELPLATGASSGDSDQVSYLDFFSDDSLSPGEVLEERETRQRVQEVVSRMPDNLREVLILGYYQRFPYKEIADILSIPLGTVKSRLHAAVTHFSAAYKKFEQESTPTRKEG